MLAVTAILSRALTPADYGEFFLLTSLVAVFAVVVALGQHQMVVRELGRNPDAGYRRSIVGRSLLVVASAAAVGGVVVGLLGGQIGAAFDLPHLAQLAWSIAWWVFVAAVLRVAVEAARGLRMLSLAAFFNAESVIGGAATLVFLLAMLVPGVLRQQVELGSAVRAVAVAMSLSVVCVLVALDRHWRKLRVAPTSVSAKVYVASGLPVVLGALVSLALVQGTLWIVHAVLAADRVAVFGSARTLANLALVPLTMVAAALLPRISSAHYAGRRSELEQAVRGSTSVALTLTLAVVIPALAAPKLLLGTLFGPYFADGSTALRLLVVGSLLNVLSGPWGFVLLQTGNHKLFVTISVLGAALSLSIAYWFAQFWGIEGVAAAWLIGQAVLASAGVVALRRRLGIVPLPMLSLSAVLETLRSRF